MDELMRDWRTAFEEEQGHSLIAGLTLSILAVRPDQHDAVQHGPLIRRQSAAFSIAADTQQPVVFAITDDPPQSKLGTCIWQIKPDPGFIPDGVAAPG